MRPQTVGPRGVRLLLVRHGQTRSNVRGVLDTAFPGPGLTQRGAAQAKVLPATLAGLEVAAIYASSLVRTQLTAAPLASHLGLPVLVRDGFREIGAGELEMEGDRASIESYLSTIFAWPAGDLERRMPGGEDGHEMLARFDQAIGEVVARLTLDAAPTGVPTAVVVSHGGAIRTWVASRATNVDAAFAACHQLDNTDVVVIAGDPAIGWRVASWSGHAVG